MAYYITWSLVFSIGLLILPLLIYLASAKFRSKRLYIGTGFLVIGVALIFIGFWNADFAFNHAEFGSGNVGVPFVGTFAPGELWNVAWVLSFVGAVYAIFGGLVIGQCIPLKK